jgi:hypothetical protein
MVQNMCIGGKWMWQGAWAHKATSPDATLAPATSQIYGMDSRRSHKRWSISVWFKGQDEAALDPWAHCHPPGGPNQPTNYLLDQDNYLTYHATDFGEQSRPYDRKSVEMDVDNTPRHRPKPKAPPPPHLAAYRYPPHLLQVIKGGVELGREVPPYNSKHSKLLQA